jgi:hypothetical protein
MIDLEEALAPLVERAPAPPAIESVARRGRRHRRRRAVTLVGALVLVAVVAGGAIAAMAGRDEPRVTTPPGDVDQLRVTLLDGSQLDISGPASLGLTDLPLSFNAELDLDAVLASGHSFVVQRTPPAEPGPVVARYPTADAHELVVYRTPNGVDAVVQYDQWALVVNWNHDPTNWAAFAGALDAQASADGFVVLRAPHGWRLGPTDAPDVRLGDYAFFGPAHKRCPNEVLTPAAHCNTDATVLSRALDPSLAGTLDGIKVSYTDSDHARATVTALDGSRYEITAPSSALGTLIFHATVAIDGVETPEPIIVNALRVGPRPSHPADRVTADGHEVFDNGSVLHAQYGSWTIMIGVDRVPAAVRDRIAELFSARVTPEGFVVLDPRPPLHVVPGPDASMDISGVGIVTSDGDPRVEPRRADVHVREVP